MSKAESYCLIGCRTSTLDLPCHSRFLRKSRPFSRATHPSRLRKRKMRNPLKTRQNKDAATGSPHAASETANAASIRKWPSRPTRSCRVKGNGERATGNGEPQNRQTVKPSNKTERGERGTGNGDPSNRQTVKPSNKTENGGRGTGNNPLWKQILSILTIQRTSRAGNEERGTVKLSTVKPSNQPRPLFRPAGTGAKQRLRLRGHPRRKRRLDRRAVRRRTRRRQETLP